MLVSQSFSSSGSNIIHGNSEMYKHQVTPINTVSILGPSRTGIVYHQGCWI